MDRPRQAFEDILQKLQTDYLDLLLIHWPGKSKVKPTDIRNQQFRVECYRVLESLVKEKKVRSIGVSNFKAHHLRHLMEHCSIVPQVNQFELHPFYQEQETIQFCRDHGIQI